MKDKYKNLILLLIALGLLVSTIILLAFDNPNYLEYNNSSYVLTSELKTSDTSYSFENDNFYTTSIENENFTDTYNVRNEQYYTGNYKGSYSFDDEVGYINSSITFINSVTPSTYCKREIINSYYNHNSVLNCTYNGGTGNHWFYNILDVDKNYGIIEFWCLFDSVSSPIDFYGRDSAYNILYHIIATATNFYYYDGSTYTNTGITSTIHTWYHIKLEFNSTSDKWSFWLNGKNIVIDADFQQTSGLLRAFTLMYNQLHKSVYLDAIGYSWFSPDYNFEDRDLYSYFDTDYPYNNWDYYNGGTTFAVFENFQAIDGQYLRLYDDDITDSVELEEYFNQQVIEGSISFYFRAISNDVISSFCQSYIYLQKDATKSIQFWINNTGGYLYYKSTPYEESIILLDYNTWYKLQIDFNCTSLTLDLYIDDEYYGELGIPSGTTYLSRIGFFTQTIYNCYLDIDSIECSWGYNIGDNLLPQKEYLDYLETNAFEFSFEDINDMTDAGDDNPLGWDDIETTGDYVNVVKQGTNGLVYIQNSGVSSTRGIEKDDFGLDDEFIQVDFGLNYEQFNTASDYNLLQIYSSDNTVVVQLYEINSGELYFYNVTKSDYSLLSDEITDDDDYSFEIYISYEIDIAIIDIYVNDDFYSSTITKLCSNNKEGLNKVKITTVTTSASEFNLFLDYVAIQGNNSYIPDEYSFTAVSMNDTLNLLHNNLFYFNVNGNCSFGISDSGFVFDTIITPYYYFNNSDYIYNVYNYYDDYNWVDAYLISWLYNDYQLNSFKFDGVKLTEGSNEYWLIYDDSNLDIDDGYFYVSSNKLYYTITIDDSNLEYMSATFDINNFNVYNESFGYTSYKSSNDLYGEVRLVYSDLTYSYSTVKYSTNSERVNLKLGKVMNYIMFLITDDDSFDDTTITGYFSSLKFTYTSNIDITTSNLLNALVPLLFFILVPSLIVMYTLDKTKVKEENRGKVLMGLLFLFSIFAFVVSQIEMWMLFLILIAFGVLFYNEIKKEKQNVVTT